jgi:hypothetical protein
VRHRGSHRCEVLQQRVQRRSSTYRPAPWSTAATKLVTLGVLGQEYEQRRCSRLGRCSLPRNPEVRRSQSHRDCFDRFSRRTAPSLRRRSSRPGGAASARDRRSDSPHKHLRAMSGGPPGRWPPSVCEALPSATRRSRRPQTTTQQGAAHQLRSSTTSSAKSMRYRTIRMAGVADAARSNFSSGSPTTMIPSTRWSGRATSRLIHPM